MFEDNKSWISKMKKSDATERRIMTFVVLAIILTAVVVALIIIFSFSNNTLRSILDFKSYEQLNNWRIGYRWYYALYCILAIAATCFRYGKIEKWYKGEKKPTMWFCLLYICMRIAVLCFGIILVAVVVASFLSGFSFELMWFHIWRAVLITLPLLLLSCFFVVMRERWALKGSKKNEQQGSKW